MEAVVSRSSSKPNTVTWELAVDGGCLGGGTRGPESWTEMHPLAGRGPAGGYRAVACREDSVQGFHGVLMTLYSPVLGLSFFVVILKDVVARVFARLSADRPSKEIFCDSKHANVLRNPLSLKNQIFEALETPSMLSSVCGTGASQHSQQHLAVGPGYGI